jgi:hypothetical protein
MKYYWIILLSACSIMLPVTSVLVRWQLLKTKYLPLAVLFLLGAVNELASYLASRWYHNNIFISDLFSIIEYLLLLRFFRGWQDRKQVFRWLATAGLLLWLCDNFLLHPPGLKDMIFRSATSLLIVALSMIQINRLLFADLREASHRADLLVMLVSMVFYAYQALISIFQLFPLSLSESAYITFWLILAIVNIICNTLYMIAIVWLPKQQAYTSHW